jgi:hypothetical protein
VRQVIGLIGEFLLDNLLDWDAATRPSAAQVTQHAFLNPDRFGLGGHVAEDAHACQGFAPLSTPGVWTGVRHDWDLLVGQLDIQVLEWLRLDLQENDLDIVWTGKRPNVKTEHGRKFIMAGAMVDDPVSADMCRLKLTKPLPLPRVRAWLAAWKQANSELLLAMAQDARASAIALEPEKEDLNRIAFLKTPWKSWLLAAGEVCIANAEGSWPEAVHKDGGASTVHMGLTLYGTRRLTCWQADGSTVVLDNLPGTVYCGGLTGPEHQVVHTPSAPDQLYRDTLSVSVMVRTTLFPETQSRLRDVTPAPQNFFRALAHSIKTAFASGAWRLPSFEECKRAASSLEASSPAGASEGPAKRKRN